ncbi:hypothetical protein A8990_12278 [Paenibacillus taihuensis]|uniref:Uncharacterized protein n=1 Tax=Paenibacillus taihuensis TaxID=1156355 RepID=A0A3D9RRJ7_9BACL|nr:hypothetical protein [Paenibacillus taihuensis]REE80124.1 hypothetical protein A8990_12278 [Paenibacillus taihuensis]
MVYFYFASIAGIVGLSGYSIVRTRLRSAKLSCMAGMMIAMTIAMMASVSVGTIIGILYPHDLTSPTVLAVLLGIVCGYMAGKPVSAMAALDGMLAGIMGGMMGAMLGVMLGSHPEMMAVFIDVVFLFIHVVLQQLIREESRGSGEETAAKVKESVLFHPYVFAFGIFILAAVFLYQI